MKALKHHLTHLLMCAPMIVIAGILLASGAGVGAILPLVACMAMMVLMMGGMHGHRRDQDPNQEGR